MNLSERIEKRFFVSTGSFEGGGKYDAEYYKSEISNCIFLITEQTDDCHFSVNQMDDGPGFILRMKGVVIAPSDSLVVEEPPNWLRIMIKIFRRMGLLRYKKVNLSKFPDANAEELNK